MVGISAIDIDIAKTDPVSAGIFVLVLPEQISRHKGTMHNSSFEMLYDALVALVRSVNEL